MSFWKQRVRLAAFSFFGLGLAVVPVHAQNWMAPTPEELHMTSIPEVPGAEAVILNRDELDEDDNHMSAVYYRIKILTEEGIRRGDVELGYDRRSDLRGYAVGEITGRTIQPDGTIVPFTGKPYDKLLHKDKENAYTARVFSMPAVQVGSIIEYRYTYRWDDRIFFRPNWIIQTDLFLRKGHFLWKPTNKTLRSVSRNGREQLTEGLMWSSSLPKGDKVDTIHLPNDRLLLETSVTNVMPFLREEHMPPLESTRYHVFFYYSPYRDANEFWKTEAGYWNSDTNKFTSLSDIVRKTAAEQTAGSTTDEAKARKLYAYVMTLENTDYTRARSAAEEKKEVKSAEDVLTRKHGNSSEITMTYVALLRAAGLQAWTMQVADRAQRLMNANWMDFGAQLTDTVAVVNYGGADHFLDPGSRYNTFGHLGWEHTITGGYRQDNKDAAHVLSQTPAEGYKYSHSSRIADLKLETDGHMSGTVSLTYEGSPALRWRHVALRTDDAELRDRIRKEIESLMPGGTTVEVKGVTGLQDGEVPLKITASVQGNIGTAVGSRVMLPAMLFEANSRPAFPHERRDQPVYFSYPEYQQDAVRYKLPAGFTVESAPTGQKLMYKQLMAYTTRSAQTLDSVTVWRDFINGDVYYSTEDYPEMRSFYSKLEHDDHGSVVLKRTGATSTTAANTGAQP